MLITLQRLKGLQACSAQLVRFEQYFGDSVVVTRELCEKHAQDFDWDWAAHHFLTVPAIAEYDRVMDAARTEFDRVMDAARTEYAARAEYDRVTGAALAEYYRVMDAARAERRRAGAHAFASLME